MCHCATTSHMPCNLFILLRLPVMRLNLIFMLSICDIITNIEQRYDNVVDCVYNILYYGMLSFCVSLLRVLKIFQNKNTSQSS